MGDSEFDLPAYLERLGLGDVPKAGVQTLARLHEAHVATIPFENLDILLGRAIELELPALQTKLVTSRRGGYCFEQNTLFRAALEKIGFQVTSLAARVRLGTTSLRPRTHMLLRVDVESRSFLADVGFGADGLLHPLPLEDGAEMDSHIGGHRLRQEKDTWVLQGKATGEWTDLYAFTLEPHFPVDFEMANHFTSTHPRSGFVQNLTVQRLWPGGNAVLRNRELTLRDGASLKTIPVRDPEHLLELLDEHFGLRFPAETRFSKPEF